MSLRKLRHDSNRAEYRALFEDMLAAERIAGKMLDAYKRIDRAMRRGSSKFLSFLKKNFERVCALDPDSGPRLLSPSMPWKPATPSYIATSPR